MPLSDLAILEDVLHEESPDSFDIRYVKDALPGMPKWRVVIGVKPIAGAGSGFSLIEAFQLALSEFAKAKEKPRLAVLGIGNNGPTVQIPITYAEEPLDNILDASIE